MGTDKLTGHFDVLEDRQAFVLEQYERLWEGVREKADDAIARGEKDLSRLHLSMRRIFGKPFNDPHLAEKYETHERKKRASGYILDRQLIQFNEMDSRLTTFINDAIKMRAVIDAFGIEPERIIETGAGWGKTLYNLYLYGGPLEAEYWALELTKAGREVCQLLAKTANSAIQIQTGFINYYEPDFSILGPEEKSTCVVTHHSIEQIPEIGGNYIEGLLSIPGFHRCVHIEPVGWQIPTNNWLAESKSYDACETMKKIDEDNKRFSIKKNQNRNLYPLLREYEKAGKIRIYRVRKYLCSHLINNATTLIAWGPGTGQPMPDEQLISPERDDLLPSTPPSPESSSKPNRQKGLSRLVRRVFG